MTALARKVGLIVASSRRGGNGVGIAQWLKPVLQTRLSQTNPVEVVAVDPHAPPHPLGPLTDGSKFPGQVTNPQDYATPAIRQWSQFVSSCSAFVILSPEYNGGYPGELKNALDHLYHEWSKKPVTVVTYGPGGGGRAAKQLTEIVKNLQMRTTETQPQIIIPRELVGGNERVDPAAAFLKDFVPTIEKAAEELEKLADGPSA